MPSVRLTATRSQILAFRRDVGALGERQPAAPASTRRAAWGGLQDSMPRAALLSLHARMEGIDPTALDDPGLVQVWGPRFSAYVVAVEDLPVFTVGRHPDDGAGRERAVDLAARLRDLLGEGEMTYGEAGRALGVHPNALRYAATTGTVVISWDGARQPTIRSVPPPDVDPHEARLELARRYLHVFGPGSAEGFAAWAGIRPRHGIGIFESLRPSLVPVGTPIGDRWILDRDEPGLRSASGNPPSARLLPSGDTYYLLQGGERELLIPDPGLRERLWTSRVWPGALLIGEEIAGTWRRVKSQVTVDAWRRLSARERQAVESEAALLPLPGVEAAIDVVWQE